MPGHQAFQLLPINLPLDTVIFSNMNHSPSSICSEKMNKQAIAERRKEGSMFSHLLGKPCQSEKSPSSYNTKKRGVKSLKGEEKENTHIHTRFPDTKIIPLVLRLPLIHWNWVVVKDRSKFQLTHVFPSHTHKQHIKNWDQLMRWLESSAIWSKTGSKKGGIGLLTVLGTICFLGCPILNGILERRKGEKGVRSSRDIYINK